MMTKINGSVFARLRAGIQGEPSAVTRICRFVLKAPLRARNLSIEELAQACGASAATVHRFCRDLGYGGYKEFQLDLAASLGNSDVGIIEDFDENARPKTIVRQVFEYNRQSLGDTARMLDVRILVRVATLMQRSRRVIFVGIGASALVARYASLRLLSLGLPALAVVDPYLQIFVTENVGPEDVLVGISHTGQTAHVIEAVRTARRRGARTVALTNYPRSPLAAASNLRLVTAFPEHRINAAVSSSIIPQLCVINSLYFILGSWGGRKARRIANEAERRAQRILRTLRPKKGKPSSQGR